MRRMLVGLALVVAGCGGSESLARYDSVDDIIDEMNKQGVECVDSTSSTDDAGDGLVEDGFCKYGSEYVNVFLYENRKAVEEANEEACQGVDVQGENWEVSPEDDRDAERMAKALRGKVVTYDGPCPKR